MMRDRNTLILICFAILTCAAAVGVLAAPPAIPANAPSVFVADRGKFRVTINGQQIGSEEFSIAPSGDAWLERSSMSAHGPGGAEIKASGQLRLAADGSPVHYDWSAEAQKKASGSVEFSGSTAKCSADFGGANPLRKDFTFNSPHVAVLDNNLYYQFAILARQYDWKAGGKQTFPVLIPQDMVPGTISVESVESQPAGKEISEALRASTPDLEIMLYLDSAYRLVRLEVPSSKAVIERE
ncbi:MAG TPA: hypothetical protein VNY09_03945 [Candidatus Sulfotelmatobacter sp.]|jgi:hypothetical protein|nr:hypothetical protein [Candidatus Sulfotelmatobacter sp.]